jgi:hypothetical protein
MNTVLETCSSFSRYALFVATQILPFIQLNCFQRT